MQYSDCCLISGAVQSDAGLIKTSVRLPRGVVCHENIGNKETKEICHQICGNDGEYCRRLCGWCFPAAVFGITD